MHTRHPRPPARLLWKAGLSCLLAASAEMPFLARAEALPEPPDCREVTPSVAMAPELLALADWPLDLPAAGCTAAPEPVAEEAPALPVEEVASYPAVVRVVAGEETAVLAEGEMADGELASVSPENAPNPLDERVAALDASALDGIRGGFETPDGALKFSFGIERAVYINGELVASTVLNLKDLQGVAGTGVPAALAGSALTVIQNGGGNGFSAQINPNQAGTVIQNTLNDQRIVNVTTINAAVNSAQVLRAMALQSAIRDGVVGSLRR
ncbi:MAG TPA: hypothetical protein VFF03_05830 [Rhodocyclaceae bacterium]|nr:hypothetical protein [Rhodocyclaceae bacterium]